MSDISPDSSSPEVESQSQPESLAPISAANRIDAMDILRGLALVGILLMNVEWFTRSMASMASFDTGQTGLDHAVGWLIRCFVEGKFYKLFALLFGMGFAVMLIRAEEADRPFGAWFSRRMLVLFIIGMLHMIFLWGGDILHDYAFAGFVFLGWIFLLRRKRFQKFNNPRSFLKIGLVWLAIPMVLASIIGIGFGVSLDHDRLETQWQKELNIASMVATELERDPVEDAVEGDEEMPSDSVEGEHEADTADAEAELSEEEQLAKSVKDETDNKQELQKKIQKENAAFTSLSYWEATQFRMKFAGFMLMLTPALTLMMLVPIFMLGYWLISSGVMRNHKDYGHIFRPMATIGLGFGLVFSVAAVLIIQHPATRVSGLLRPLGQTLFLTGQYALAAGYLGVTIRLLNSPKWAKSLNRFAPMGRMALTNYIMQSVILTSLFYGYAGGMYGEISRAPQMLLVVGIIVFQLFFSTWWLNRYRFGPLEWLWRSLTYMKRQPMRYA